MHFAYNMQSFFQKLTRNSRVLCAEYNKNDFVYPGGFGIYTLPAALDESCVGKTAQNLAFHIGCVGIVFDNIRTICYNI